MSLVRIGAALTSVVCMLSLVATPGRAQLNRASADPPATACAPSANLYTVTANPSQSISVPLVETFAYAKPADTPAPQGTAGSVGPGLPIPAGAIVTLYQLDRKNGKLTVAYDLPTPPTKGDAASTALPATPAPAFAFGGAPGHPVALIDDATVAHLGSPIPVASPIPTGGTQFITAQVPLSGAQPGVTTMRVSDGVSCYQVRIKVKPSNTDRFVVSVGFGASDVPAHSFTAVNVTPAPSGVTPPAAAPGYYVNQSELSSGQTFVPILASYRVTDFPEPFNVYASAGFAVNGDPNKLLFGLSVGNNDALLTFGYHTAQTESLNTHLHVGYNGPQAAPYVSNLTYAQRTTALYAGLTFSASKLVCLLAVTITSTCLSSAGTANTPATSPSPTAT